MAAGYNRVILIGNLTRDPEMRYIQSGTPVSTIGLAINEKRKGRDGQFKDETTFVDVTCWGKTAEIASHYLHKGSPVMFEGRLKLDTWQDKQTGQNRSKLGIVADKMQMLGQQQPQQMRAAPQQPTQYQQQQQVPPQNYYQNPNAPAPPQQFNPQPAEYRQDPGEIPF